LFGCGGRGDVGTEEPGLGGVDAASGSKAAQLEWVIMRMKRLEKY
jgi:hypothetical protein